MAFSTLQWIESGFSEYYLRENITTIEDALTVANQILADRDIVALGGSEAPLNWASEVPYRLAGKTGELSQVVDEQGGTDITAGDTVFGWLSGANQSNKKTSYLSMYEEKKQEISDEIANFQSNIANLQDYPEGISDEEKAKLDERVQAILDENADLLDAATALGINVPEAIKTDTGYIPAFEATQTTTNSTGMRSVAGHTGDFLNIVDNGDGTYDIIGTSGTTYQTGITSLSDALARQTELQSGAYPDATGAFAPEETPTTGTATSATGINPDTGLPYNVDLSSLTEDQIAYLQKISELAGTDYDLLNSLLSDYQITDEDMSEFLKTAQEEVEPYYTQIFSRGLEDFTNALEVEAQARALELESEALSKAQALRNARSSLEASGMTFTGEAVRDLGAESAYTQESLGAELPEGEIPQAQRLLASSSQARYEQDIRGITRSAEEYYGSEALAGASIPTLEGTPVTSITSGVRGTLEAEQETAEQTRAAELAQEEAVRRAMLLSTEDSSSQAIINML